MFAHRLSVHDPQLGSVIPLCLLFLTPVADERRVAKGSNPTSESYRARGLLWKLLRGTAGLNVALLAGPTSPSCRRHRRTGRLTIGRSESVRSPDRSHNDLCTARKSRFKCPTIPLHHARTAVSRSLSSSRDFGTAGRDARSFGSQTTMSASARAATRAACDLEVRATALGDVAGISDRSPSERLPVTSGAARSCGLPPPSTDPLARRIPRP